LISAAKVARKAAANVWPSVYLTSMESIQEVFTRAKKGSANAEICMP